MLTIRAQFWIDALSLIVDRSHAIQFVKPEHVQLVLVIPAARSKLKNGRFGPLGNFVSRPTPKFGAKLSDSGHLDGFHGKCPFTPQTVLPLREQIHASETIL